MRHAICFSLLSPLLASLAVGAGPTQTSAVKATKTAADAPPSTAPAADRMAWWREARFGLFIHWGLYALPAGQWGERTNHGEWIMHTAQIPIEEYEQLRSRFNPVKFNAAEWARIAKEAGMKYVVITSKHHDGFCLFDSQYTDYDVMSTPFKRDILRELADAVRAAGLQMGFYHSIMDWHHPDYLPRRDWEERPAAGAEFERYAKHLHNQVRELLANYAPLAIMWFDGEWEGTWTHPHGVALYNLVRSVSPATVINNRVDKGRSGMAGLTVGEHLGDFGTPEQEVPPQGLPGVDWESCITMNDHWGYNKADKNFKSSRELIQLLADTASKGGNLLLNVGPTAAGEFPPECVERLAALGRWLNVNGEAIYGTQAGPFPPLPWGRCTQKRIPAADGDHLRLYLHVFERPADGRLLLPGLAGAPRAAYLLAAAPRPALETTRAEDALVVHVPAQLPDTDNTVIVLEYANPPEVFVPPAITAAGDIFIDATEVGLSAPLAGEHVSVSVELRYTLDGTPPSADSTRAAGPLRLTETATITARAFRNGQPVSPVARRTLMRVTPRAGEKLDPTRLERGVAYDYYEVGGKGPDQPAGAAQAMPELSSTEMLRSLQPRATGRVETFTLAPRKREESFGFRFRALLNVPRTGIYSFYTDSDDGSRLYIGDQLVVDNDGLHGARRIAGQIALAAGLHPVTVWYFERGGEQALEVGWAAAGQKQEPQPVSPNVLLFAPAEQK